MLFVNDALRYFLYRHPADMCKSFYSLAALVTEHMKGDPLSGDVFIFISRRHNQIKLLRWEGDGFAIYTKRLEKGTYEIPSHHDNASFVLSHQQLLLILQGISLKQIHYRKRFEYKQPVCG